MRMSLVMREDVAAQWLLAGETGRLFTLGLNGPGYDLGAVRDLIAWRDARNAPV